MDQKTKILVVIIIVIFISGFLSVRYIADVSAFEKINVTVKNTSIQELGLTYCKLKLKVSISNPTTEHISGLSAEFDVSIANTHVGNGSVPKVTIPAQSHTTRDVPLTIYYANVGNAVINGIKTGNFDLTIDGTANVNVLFNLLMISKPFTASYSYP
ncbi:MAG: LEA type 2 family protein [Thermoplasmatales archaeon]|nr:MAG: LEA type 2 family protein [Thermoplasmatales archaeon]